MNVRVKSCLQYNERWDKAHLTSYYYYTGKLLQSIAPPQKLYIARLLCVLGPNHSTLIDDSYCSIVSSLQQASAKFVPKISFKSLKAYWNSELDKLKQISLDMHKLWRSIGSPKFCVINKARLEVK